MTEKNPIQSEFERRFTSYLKTTTNIAEKNADKHGLHMAALAYQILVNFKETRVEKTPFTPLRWTISEVELITKLWNDGMPAGEISKRMVGRTRNSIIGKAHRLKLVPRKSPIGEKQND